MFFLSTKDEIVKLSNPNIQDLIKNFFCIHLYYYFVFSIRQRLISSDSNKHVHFSLFNNTSQTPSLKFMKAILLQIYGNTTHSIELADIYDKLLTIRGKYAHADTNSKELRGKSITIDQFVKFFEKINTINAEVN